MFSANEKQKTFLQQKKSSTLMMLQDMMRNLKEFLITSLLFPMLGLNKSKYETPRWLEALEPRYPRLSYVTQSRINVEEENRKGVQMKREVAADSLQSIQLKILDLDTDLEAGSELGPLQYLSGLTGYSMDRIINWLILIIIFVFDPLAVALVVAFNNAMKVDRGIVDKEKVIRKRELYDEVPDDEEETPLEEIEVEELLEVKPPPKKRKPKKKKEFDKADLDKDGIVTEERKRHTMNQMVGETHIKEILIINTHGLIGQKEKDGLMIEKFINFWINNRGGSQHQLEKIKEQYPTDFTKKTY